MAGLNKLSLSFLLMGMTVFGLTTANAVRKGVTVCDDTEQQDPQISQGALNCTLNSTGKNNSMPTIVDQEDLGQNDRLADVLSTNNSTNTTIDTGNRGQTGDQNEVTKYSTQTMVGTEDPGQNGDQSDVTKYSTQTMIDTEDPGQNGNQSDVMNNSTRLMVHKENPGQNDEQRDDSKGNKTKPDHGIVNTEAIIAVVATLAILCIVICSAILIAKCVKKRRSRERPLLVSSHKLEQNNPDVPLDQFFSAKGYVNVDETKDAFSLSDYRLSAPSAQGANNTSFTDTIDLDGNEAADSVRPSESKINQESFSNTDQKAFDPSQLDGQSSPGPVSYESAFEGSLEQLRHEMTTETSDGGSSEEINQESVADKLEKDSIHKTPQNSDSNLEEQDKTDATADRESNNSESLTQTSTGVLMVSSVPDSEKDKETERERPHSNSSTLGNSSQDFCPDNQEGVGSYPDHSKEENITNEPMERGDGDGSNSGDNDVVDLTADFSEC